MAGADLNKPVAGVNEPVSAAGLGCPRAVLCILASVCGLTQQSRCWL